MKYVCDICGYVYDPELGDPDNGVAPARLGKKSPKTGSARSAASARTSSARKNKETGAEKESSFSALCRYPHTAILFFKPKLLCNLPICMVQQMCGKLYDTTNRKESFL